METYSRSEFGRCVAAKFHVSHRASPKISARFPRYCYCFCFPHYANAHAQRTCLILENTDFNGIRLVYVQVEVKAKLNRKWKTKSRTLEVNEKTNYMLTVQGRRGWLAKVHVEHGLASQISTHLSLFLSLSLSLYLSLSLSLSVMKLSNSWRFLFCI